MAFEIVKLWSGMHIVVFGYIFCNYLNIQSGYGFYNS